MSNPNTDPGNIEEIQDDYFDLYDKYFEEEYRQNLEIVTLLHSSQTPFRKNLYRSHEEMDVNQTNIINND